MLYIGPLWIDCNKDIKFNVYTLFFCGCRVLLGCVWNQNVTIIAYYWNAYTKGKISPSHSMVALCMSKMEIKKINNSKQIKFNPIK